MIVGQRFHLPARRFDQPRLAEAQRNAPQAGQAFEIFLALIVIDIDPAPAA